MSKQVYILIIFLAWFWGNGQDLTKSNIVFLKQRDLILENCKNFPNRTQIAFGIIDDGIVNYFGVELSNDSIFTTKNYSSVFEIGSVTKVFTTTLLADFTLDNKLNLEDKINNYLDTKINNSTEISFKQLANHTSGLPRLPTNLDLRSVNPNNPYQDYNEQQLKLYLTNELKLSHIPGTHYEYSNLGVGLLGYVLSKMESTAYEDLLKTYIFSKYNMSHSTTDQKKVEGLMVKGLDRSGNITSNWDLGVLVAAGGMLSTTEDLSKFVVAQFDATNKELQLTRTKTFTINNISDYGLAWEIIKRRSGAIWYKHNGGTGGYTSSIIFEIAKRNGVIILSNVSTYSNKSSEINDLSYELMKILNRN